MNQLTTRPGRPDRKPEKNARARIDAPRLFLTLLLTLTMFPAFAPVSVRAEVPGPEEILAETAVLVDADTGQVLYEKNARQAMQPASITKIMTGMLALEQLDPDELLTASAAAVDIPYWGSSAYIRAGERLTVDEAMHAMMLRSANEAANILAEAVAGSMEAFAALMNRRAAELGAENTSFQNANGLPARSHLTSAYDMALITRAAIATPGFLDYFGRASYSMAPTNLSGGRTFTNTYRMLQRGYAVYNPDVIGGKTGYTAPSGYTLVTVAEREGRTLICVVLKSNSYYADTQTLLDFGFEEFTPYTYVFEEPEPIEVSILDDGWEAGGAYLYGPEEVSLLLHQSVRAGAIEVAYAVPEALSPGEEIDGSVVLSASSEAEGLPETLLRVAMEAEVTTFEPEIVEAAVRIELPADPAPVRPALIWIAAPLTALCGLGCAALIVKNRRRRYHWRRRRRRNRGNL